MLHVNGCKSLKANVPHVNFKTNFVNLKGASNANFMCETLLTYDKSF